MSFSHDWLILYRVFGEIFDVGYHWFMNRVNGFLIFKFWPSTNPIIYFVFFYFFLVHVQLNNSLHVE